jgi:Protein of unknown function (DUF3040)
VPLSEEELRLLEQMERALSAEDPKFASTLRGTSFRRAARRRAVLAGVVFAGGVTVLMSGAILEQIAIGIVGFVIMLVSATYGLTAVRSQPAATGQAGDRSVAGDARTRRTRQDHSFMERLEDRWRRRRDDGR